MDAVTAHDSAPPQSASISSPAPSAPDGTGTTTITLTVTAAGDTERQLTESTDADLWEAKPVALLSEAGEIDRAGGVIRDTVLINARSVNGKAGGGRKYSERALRQIAALAEGLPAYANHVKNPADAFKPRPIEEMIGKHVNVRYDATQNRVLSDLQLVPHHRDWVMGLAETVPGIVGNSLVSKGLIQMEGNTEVVTDIAALRSGDLVSDPATTKGLFEHRDDWRAAQPTAPAETTTPQGGNAMKLDDILKALSEDKALAAAVRVHVAGEELKQLAEAKDAAVKTADEALAAEKVAHAATQTKLTEATAKVDAFEAADAVRAKRARLQEAIEKSDLHKKFGKVDGAVSETFVGSLMEAKEEGWAALIEDRSKMLDAAQAGRVAQQPTSVGKDAVVVTMTESKQPGADAFEKVRAALLG